MIRITSEDILALRRMYRWFVTANGEGITNSPFGISFDPPKSRRRARGGGEDPQVFPCLVKYHTSGSDADGTSSTYASWTYDVFDLADDAMSSALNDTPQSPECSRARIVVGPVTKAADGSIGLAFYKDDGSVGLFDCAEVHGKVACT